MALYPSGITELDELIREAYRALDAQLAGEDKGWIQLGTSATAIFTAPQKVDIIKRSRYYSQVDPMATQGLRLWTDYSFGSGLGWRATDDAAHEALDTFWHSPANASALSCAGQRKSSHNLLRDGSVYFALFLGPEGAAILRRIDPMEITETLTDPDDAEDICYFKREWVTPQGKQKVGYYKSWLNLGDKAAPDYMGQSHEATEEAIVYRLEREPNGLPMLLPALDWIKLYRQFLASRVAVMLALARFAWKLKVTGGQAAVDAVKGQYDQTRPDAGAMQVENMGADLQPFKTDTGASGAYQDGNMIKLQVCAAFGIPLQYFGDVSAGQYATAKTVELPMVKMFESYQSVWRDTYKDICNLVLGHAGIADDKRYVDWDFPAVTPEDAGAIAQNIAALVPVVPELSYSEDVLQAALMAVGVKDVNEAMEQLKNQAKESGDPGLRLAKALRRFQEAVKGNGHAAALL